MAVVPLVSNWPVPPPTPDPPPNPTPPSTSWATNPGTVTVDGVTRLAYLPWAGGWGSGTYGGSGRHSITGGSGSFQVGGTAAPLTVYLIGSQAQLTQACTATGTRLGLIYRSGTYNYGSNGELEIRNDGRLTLVDLSPSPGAVIVGAQVNLGSLSDICLINLMILPYVTDFSVAEFGGGAAIAHIQDTGTLRRYWTAYCATAWATDSNENYFYTADDTGSFADMNFQCLNLSVHEPVLGHSTGELNGRQNSNQRRSVIRKVYWSNMGRNPLSYGTNIDIVDGMVANWGDAGIDIAQHSVSPAAPNNHNVRNIQGVVGPNHVGKKLIRIGFTGTELHDGSQVCVTGCKTIGATDTTQADQYQNDSYTGWGSVTSTPIVAATSPGYVANAIGTETDRVALLLATSGPRQNNRAAPISAAVTAVTANASGNLSTAGRINDGQQTYPSHAQNSLDLITQSDPMPGITSMTTGGIPLSSAARVIQPSGYTLWEEWLHRQLVNRHGIIG